MPYVARLFVKAGLVYLVLTFVAGALLLSWEGLGRIVPQAIEVAHAHMGFVGWLVNTVVGVALWMLPLNRARFPATQGRYPEALARASFYALNSGLALRLVAEPWNSLAPSSLFSVLLIASALLQVAGIAAIAWIIWQRVFAPPLRPGV